MIDILQLINLVKKNFNKIWKFFLLIIITSLLANLFTIGQPLIFASMLEIVIPENFSIFENSAEVESSQAQNIFDLDNAGRLINNFIDNFLTGGQKTTLNSLIMLSLFFLVFAIFSAILNYSTIALSKWASFTLTVLIRRDLINHLLELDYLFYLRSRYSEFVSRVINDSKNVSQGLVPFFQSFFHNGTLIVFYSFFLYNTDYLLFFLSVLIFSVQYGIIIIAKNKIRKYHIEVNNLSAKLLSQLNEVFSSIRIIKIFNNKKFYFDKIQDTQNEERRVNFKAALYDKMQIPIATILTAISSVTILFLIFYNIQSGKISLQGGVLFLIMGRLMIEPIVKLSVMFTWLVSFNASYHKINYYKKIVPNITNGNKSIEKFNDEINYIDAKFYYEEKKELNFGNLKIKKNEKILLVGQSGSGKSTFADTLMRLHDLASGIITIDGQNIKEFNLNNYRSLFGFIPQEPLLFNDTILENIRCGRIYISDEEVFEAARAANIEKFIMSKKNNYKFFVGDRGSSLSGGEKQRISIARALVQKPQILILDEATSSLDLKTENELMSDLYQIFENRTVIIISHKMNLVKKVDKIVLFNDGKIDMVGNHDELHENSEIYNNLYNTTYK